MLKEMKYSDDARKKLIAGIELLYKLLIPTYGGYGGNVVVENKNEPISITNKSWEIIKNITTSDFYENQSIEIAKQAVWDTIKQSGDGGSVTVVLIYEMLKQAEIYISSGYNPMEMREGIKEACEIVCSQLEKNAVHIDEYNAKEMLYNIALGATGDGLMSTAIANTFEKMGKDAAFLVKESKKTEDYIEINKGMKIESGYISNRFLLNNKKEINYNNTYVLVTDQKISEFSKLLKILEGVVEKNKSLLIIAENIEGEALVMLEENNRKKVVSVTAVKAPGYGKRKEDILGDIAALTGTRVLNKELIEAATVMELGLADEVKIDKNSTTIISNNGNLKILNNRLNEIKEKINSKETSMQDRQLHRERYGRLCGSVACYYVGAYSEIECHERKQKAEAGVIACHLALEQGIVKGGGVAYKEAVNALEDISAISQSYKMGIEIIKQALAQPFEILRNETNENIYDAFAVLKTALCQSISVVYELMSTESVMVCTGLDREDIELMKENERINKMQG